MKTLLPYAVLILFMTSNVISYGQFSNQLSNTDISDSSFDTSISLESSAKSETKSMQIIQAISPVITFDEHPYNHNMHITSDGSYYYTINGGNTGNGQINEFSLDGTLIQTFPIQIDGRGLSYNTSDGYLYASCFGGSIYKITDLNSGSFDLIFGNIMQNIQASFAISEDGSKFYDFYAGTLRIHDFSTGNVLEEISGISSGSGNFGGDAAVAVDADHIYTWDSSIKTVYIYNHSGVFIESAELEFGDNGHSLAIANGFLFVSKDGDYDIGTWYGYDINPTSISESEKDFKLNIYPNPSKDKITIVGNNIKEVEVYNSNNQLIYSTGFIDGKNHEIELWQYSTGIYFVRVFDGKRVYTEKMVIY